MTRTMSRNLCCNVDVALPGDARATRPWPRRANDNRTPVIEIGLVNNMPDCALLTTERQFIRKVTAAAAGRPVRLHLFALPSVPRSREAKARMAGFYHDAGDMSGWTLDALIVTGTEPRARDLREEPYWQELARLVDWAATNTHSTIWSCLAAHAAVLHLDGIERKPLARKCSGVFACRPGEPGKEGLLKGMPDPMLVSHSRWNALNRDDLAACGYRILSESAAAGVDMFERDHAQPLRLSPGPPGVRGDDAAARIPPRRCPIRERGKPVPSRHPLRLPAGPRGGASATASRRRGTALRLAGAGRARRCPPARGP